MRNLDSPLFLEDSKTYILFLNDAIRALRENLVCTEINGHACLLTRYEVREILCDKALQIMYMAEKNSSPWENFLSLFVKTEKVKVCDLTTSICNYDLLRENALLKVPLEVSVVIFNLLDLSSFVQLKATCYALKMLLPKVLPEKNQASHCLSVSYISKRKQKETQRRRQIEEHVLYRLTGITHNSR